MKLEVLPDIYRVSGERGLAYFEHLLRFAGVPDPPRISQIARQTIAYVQSKAQERKASEHLMELQSRWYHSLRVTGQPDYSVYEVPDYMGDLWACWSCYSRRYLMEIQQPRSLPPLGIASTFSRGGVVVDLGNGLGTSTAALRQMFPMGRVIGTNVRNSVQWTVAEGMARSYGFEMLSDPAEVGQRASIVFASEYFEHFDKPIEHLDYVIRTLNPRVMLVANSFTAIAIGHFDTYQHGASRYEGRAMSRMWNNRMKEHGYLKRKTGLWNNRPAMWVKP
jgi:hypothetical protein